MGYPTVIVTLECSLMLTPCYNEDFRDDKTLHKYPPCIFPSVFYAEHGNCKLICDSKVRLEHGD